MGLERLVSAPRPLQDSCRHYSLCMGEREDSPRGRSLRSDHRLSRSQQWRPEESHRHLGQGTSMSQPKLPNHAWPMSRVGAGHLLMVSVAWLTGGLEELGATCKYGDLWGTCQNPPRL